MYTYLVALPDTESIKKMFCLCEWIITTKPEDQEAMPAQTSEARCLRVQIILTENANMRFELY